MSVQPRVQPRGLWAWLALVAALAVQVWLLYAPDVPGPARMPGADKVVHALLFAIPTAVVLAGGLPRWLLAVIALHAPVSEWLQGAVLSGRTGDPWDAIADLVGMALALGFWRLGGARRRGPDRAHALID